MINTVDERMLVVWRRESAKRRNLFKMPNVFQGGDKVMPKTAKSIAKTCMVISENLWKKTIPRNLSMLLCYLHFLWMHELIVNCVRS